MTTITYREATPDDLPALSELRWQMETEMRGVEGTFEDFATAYRNATQAEIDRGSHQPWLAEVDGVPVACAILIVWIVPPHIGETMRKRGFVSSVYTMPDHRRRGISTQLMTRLMNSAREQGIQRLILWASDMGAPVYESLGFTRSHAMEINL